MEGNFRNYDARRDAIVADLTQTKGAIKGIRLYLKHIHAMKHFSFGSWRNRQHIIVAIDADGHTGYAECIMSVNREDASLNTWSDDVSCLSGLEVGTALKTVRTKQGTWPEQLVEMVEMALIDLCGKIRNVSSVHLLGLKELHEVCGVHVILSDNLDEVTESANWAKECGKSRFIKVKLFGNEELDTSVIRAVRTCCPAEETYLIGDVNCGYRTEQQETPLEEIAEHLKKLHAAGLDACEDPAFLDQQEWVQLQKMTAPLELIPDYPMRPSRRSIRDICTGMGTIYNIHPDSAGSIIDAVVLAERIHDLGAGLMVGDDSLVGPSATIWQQLAAGLGAKWVEATEKRNESDFYYRSVRNLATDSNVNPIRVQLKPGFGIDMDEKELKQQVDCMMTVTG